MQQHKRKITVRSTVGSNKTEIESSATTWGELQTDLTSKNIPYKDMKVVIAETDKTLEKIDDVLSEQEFNLFLMPTKVASGF